MDPMIIGIVCVVVGFAIGWMSSILVFKMAKPEDLWNKFIWALDRAEAIPALRTKYEELAGQVKNKLEDWLKLDWMK